MRLYKLIRRVGKRRRRPYPWFDAPAAGAPLKYFGWVWSPEKGEWVETDVEPITVQLVHVPKPKPVLPFDPGGPYVVLGWEWDVGCQCWEKTPVPRSGAYLPYPYPEKPDQMPSREFPAEVDGWFYDFDKLEWVKGVYIQKYYWQADPHPPMPDYVPGPSGDDRLEDWYWDYELKEWRAIIKPVATLEFTPPRSLPPGMDRERLAIQFPLEQQYLLFIQKLIEQGLTPADAKRIADVMGEAILKTVWSQQKAVHQSVWQGATEKISAEMAYMKETIAVNVLVPIIAAAVGVFIGYTLQSFVYLDEEYISMSSAVLTYLLGPDEWIYSRNIGQSVFGAHWFSSCENIGTDDFRHKKSDWKGGRDTIDFPGGFVEAGYKFPYWIKYTWEFWEIEYVGFLRSGGAGFYFLKPEVSFTGPFHPGQSLKPEDWCYNFTYYL